MRASVVKYIMILRPLPVFYIPVESMSLESGFSNPAGEYIHDFIQTSLFFQTFIYHDTRHRADPVRSHSFPCWFRRRDRCKALWHTWLPGKCLRSAQHTASAGTASFLIPAHILIDADKPEVSTAGKTGFSGNLSARNWIPTPQAMDKNRFIIFHHGIEFFKIFMVTLPFHGLRAQVQWDCRPVFLAMSSSAFKTVYFFFSTRKTNSHTGSAAHIQNFFIVLYHILLFHQRVFF